MQLCIHKGKSRNADYIIIAAKGGDTTTLSPLGLSPPERSEHNPSTQPAAEGGHNLRRGLAPLNPLNSHFNKF